MPVVSFLTVNKGLSFISRLSSLLYKVPCDSKSNADVTRDKEQKKQKENLKNDTNDTNDNIDTRQ